MMPTRCGVLVAMLAIVAGLAGCSGESDDKLLARLDELSKNNQQLQEKVDRLSKDLRSREQRLSELDTQVQQFEKTLSQVEQDLRNRITEMVKQQMGGRRGWEPRPRIEARFEVKPYMGFDAQDLLPDVAEHLKLKAKTGVLVTDVRPGSPAAVAGMAKNDVIQRFAGQAIKDFNDLKKAFAGKKPGEVVEVNVLRGAEKLDLKVKLGAKKVRVG